MTDRIHSLVVVLDHDMRDDDVEGLIEAIRHFRFVTSVTGNVSDMNSLMAAERARYELRAKLLRALEE